MVDLVQPQLPAISSHRLLGQRGAVATRFDPQKSPHALQRKPGHQRTEYAHVVRDDAPQDSDVTLRQTNEFLTRQRTGRETQESLSRTHRIEQRARGGRTARERRRLMVHSGRREDRPLHRARHASRRATGLTRDRDAIGQQIADEIEGRLPGDAIHDVEQAGSRDERQFRYRITTETVHDPLGDVQIHRRSC